MNKKFCKLVVNQSHSGINFKCLLKNMSQLSRKQGFVTNWDLPIVEAEIAIASYNPLERYDMTDAVCVQYIMQKSMSILQQPRFCFTKDMSKAFKIAIGLRKSIENRLILGEPS